MVAGAAAGAADERLGWGAAAAADDETGGLGATGTDVDPAARLSNSSSRCVAATSCLRSVDVSRACAK